MLIILSSPRWIDNGWPCFFEIHFKYLILLGPDIVSIKWSLNLIWTPKVHKRAIAGIKRGEKRYLEGLLNNDSKMQE